MKRCVLIVGLDRSGTSATALLCRNLGVEFYADQLSPTEANPTGYIEHAAINNSLNKGEFDEVERAADEMRSKEIWGLKDPRLAWPANLRGAIAAIKAVDPEREILIVETHRRPECIYESRRALGAVETVDDVALLQANKGLAVAKTGLLSVTIHYDTLVDHPELAAWGISALLGLPCTEGCTEGIDKKHRHYG